MARLFVNVDHVATLRQARLGRNPDPILQARICEDAGAAGITVHLREDRRHIQDEDVRRLKRSLRTPFNLEMSVATPIQEIALEIRPEQVTLVPEKRQELTTEGGLDLDGDFDRIRAAVRRQVEAGILVSLFIDAGVDSIRRAKDSGATHIELHTGRYAAESAVPSRQRELIRLQEGAALAQSLGLVVNAGHGLDFENSAAVAAIPGMNDLNIGHAIVADALVLGMHEAVARMVRLVQAASRPAS